MRLMNVCQYSAALLGSPGGFLGVWYILPWVSVRTFTLSGVEYMSVVVRLLLRSAVPRTRIELSLIIRLRLRKALNLWHIFAHRRL
jgi:hypothetical protein